MVIEYFDKLYPERLRKIKNPPTRLYAIGNVDILNELGIAVVGSRTNTQYGEKMCKEFTKNLVEYNINIISGLAIGIDEIAHKTCIKNFGKTIAVLPSGLDNIYPVANKKLAKNIIENGGVVLTEYDNNVIADSKKFIERNRIVAGLGIGTLVVEAGVRSGTSVTARFTKEQEKPVFCIPSSLDNIKGKTTNELIKKGAFLVTCIDDILSKYPNESFIKQQNTSKNIDEDIIPELSEVYKIIDTNPKDINEIAIKLKIPVKEVMYKVMLLQIDEKIKELPGQKFIRNNED